MLVIPYPTAQLLFPLIQDDIVEYEKSIDEIDPDTGEVTYHLSVYHWKDGDIIRHKFHYDLNQRNVDSIIKIEDQISEKFKQLD